MIERYFLTGVRLRWDCPGADAGQVKDGRIIDSPPRGAAPMTYDGLDGELFDAGAPHTSTVGLTMRMNIPYQWLVYGLGVTTRRPITGLDTLTGPMSGCLIVEWSERGQRYVGHVGTVESSAEISRKVKQVFLAALPTQARGFNPAQAWTPNEIAAKMMAFKKRPAFRIVALVTSGGDFYSLLMFELQSGVANEWCVGGCKKVAPMNSAALRIALA